MARIWVRRDGLLMDWVGYLEKDARYLHHVAGACPVYLKLIAPKFCGQQTHEM
jgi:hypothetical protein